MSDDGLNTAVSPSAPAVIPRLSILHLLLWTGFTAACITCASWIPQYWFTPNENSSLLKLLRLPLAVLDGAAITAFVVLLPMAIFTFRSLLPGHWILLAWGGHAAIANLAGLGTYAATAEARLGRDSTSGSRWVDELYVTLLVLAYGIALPFVLTAFRSLHRSKSWKVYFALRVAAAAIAMILFLCVVLTYFLRGFGEVVEPIAFFGFLGERLSQAAAFVTLLIAAALDRRAGRGGDWLHYTGLFMVLLYPLANVILYVGGAIAFGMTIQIY